MPSTSDSAPAGEVASGPTRAMARKYGFPGPLPGRTVLGRPGYRPVVLRRRPSMAIVRAGPNEYLLVGQHGVLENRGSAVTNYLRPGTIYVLVPSTKQEAAFEFTQETKDGVPLRFKGTFIYRIADPVAAAAMFDFTKGDGTTQITTLLTHVCYGELRHAVSHMTMVECIEQRKTTLSGVVAA